MRPPMEVEQIDRRSTALGDLRILPDEILCDILTYLTPRDVARLSCVSSVMYILCNEEPLWMSLCIDIADRQLQYKGSWKRTALDRLNVTFENDESCQKPLHFDGFNSLFLYRRLYRCYTSLNGFYYDTGNVERAKNLSIEEFRDKYDGQKPVLIGGLADTWPARTTWTTEELLKNYGDTAFKLSQRSRHKIRMKLKDYVSYTKVQHDEDPLYIFDEKFGEAAPELLKDYSVPNMFKEDFFDVLDRDQRPPFRWLIMGPERSGASWHVDPALTSAWNTLLCGRKRWALYPPGRVPLGVTVHVNEEDGDVSIDAPSSLQWWLDFYPLLAEEDKPIECTQLPGETIFVPSGWWHCVLNLETTVAVTQNFVNSKNFEFVCLDMAPGYRHKGVCRAGLLALDDISIEDVRKNMLSLESGLSCSDLSRKEKRTRVDQPAKGSDNGSTINGVSECIDLREVEFSYDINFLAMFLDKERDHYTSLWSSSNSIGQREMREWLSKLWVGKPEARDIIWKGACLALNADRWHTYVTEICTFHGLPLPTDDERLPVGTGSNPVYLAGDNVIKILVEEGLEACLHSLGTELEFYSLLQKINSPLRNHIPSVLASGILYIEDGMCKVQLWDGKGVPGVVANFSPPVEHEQVDYPFGLWSKRQFDYRKAGMSLPELVSAGSGATVWPYVITQRCKGKIYAQIRRDSISWEDALNLASFLGEQMRNLHLVPCPALNDSTLLETRQKAVPNANGNLEDDEDKICAPGEWNLFLRTLNRKRKDVCDRLTKWGDPIPRELIEKVEEYIPDDLGKVDMGVRSCTWIHSDVMDDNIHMEPCSLTSRSGGTIDDPELIDNVSANGSDLSEPVHAWRPTHILDFSGLSVGDPISDLIPIHLDVFRGDPHLLKQFLDSYKLPCVKTGENASAKSNGFQRLSYRAMCYCILHDENVLGAIFGTWKELRTAKSWEEVEEAVWGDLNNYTGSC
ncbi:lysine-specific demethylase JMJ21 isoform X1 [Lycium ferocissimum]|uniref:lysine-specific demethylase JMJ21 isoform X1 n=1 Tax=Lycium ferocissimum TaxID=112874 RepID=UPI002815F85A|nr:lysine-specific demethylase JMJ21 isoform X1 [Lycium ferocissimum]